MAWAGCAKILVSTLLVSLVLTTCLGADVTQSLCEDGWVFNRGLCYFFSSPHDTRTPFNADLECYLRDATFVYPESKEELDFLQTKVKTKNAYGYIFNLRTYSDNRFIVEKRMTSSIIDDPPAGSIPEVQPAFDVSSGDVCAAFHLPEMYSWFAIYMSDGGPKAWFETVDCSVLLRVACQSKTSNPSLKTHDADMLLKKGEYTYWMSGDLASFSDAKKACANKGMDVIDKPSDFISVLNRTLYDATPWWSKAKVGQVGPQWTDGSSSDSTWGVDNTGDKAIVLRNSGKASYITGYENQVQFPYICKKNSVPAGQFGCDGLWMRGGRSCYKLHPRRNVNWEEAKQLCEKQNAHLLTIDSALELTWLKSIRFGNGRHRWFDEYWTSGNDREKEGVYKWHDGSKIDNLIFKWKNGPSYAGSYGRRCAAIWVNRPDSDSYFLPQDCHRESNSIACQYELRNGITDCASNWKKHGNMCYYLNYDVRTTRDLNIPRCISESGIGTLNGVRYLEVRNKDVAKFLDTNFKGMYWVGIYAGHVVGEYTWFDGTKEFIEDRLDVDIEPNNGGKSGKPENCIVTDLNGLAYDKDCVTSRYPFMCEKDLPPLPKP